MPNYILPFALPAATLALAGGKGLNLAALAQAKFPVPQGFIVTTEAYRAFVAANQLQPRILAQAQALALNDLAALEAASAAIAELFAQGQMPAELAEAISARYAALPPANAPVAVRSSATAEDLPGFSFAGQQDTYLNIVGPAAVLDAVKRCWASLWTARAIGYRARNHIPPEDVALAVVVQPMIESEVSGVLFTANPLTGHRGQMVIDASFGLGEAIVSGQVEPDHYVVETATNIILERKLGAKALVIQGQAGGGTVHTQPTTNAQQQALPDAQIMALTQLAAQVAQHYGEPQDIEWAWAKGQLYLLQSRPITSLYPLPNMALPTDKLGVYFSFASVQGLPDPLTPLGRDVLRQLLGGLIVNIFKFKVNLHQVFLEAGERLFLNFTVLAHHPRLQKVLLAMLERIDPGAKQVVQQLMAQGRLTPQAGHDTAFPKFMLRFLWKFAPRALAGQIAPHAALANSALINERFLTAAAVRLQTAPPTLAGRLAAIETSLSQGFETVVLSLMPAVFPAIAGVSIVDGWLVRWGLAKPGAALALMRGLPGNVTTTMDLQLWATAQALRAHAPSAEAFSTQSTRDLVWAYQQHTLPAVAQREVQRFLDAYGMRAVAEIDFGRLRWRDDPSSVFQTLQSYLQLTDPNAAPDVVFKQGEAAAEALAADYVAQARRTPWGWLRAPVLAFVIGRMRLLAGARETPKFNIIKLFDLLRTTFKQIGQTLVQHEQLDQMDDIFFVPLADLKRLAGGATIDLRSIVARNRAAYDQEMARRQTPRILLSTGEAFYEGVRDATAGPNDLVGQAVSPGVCEGTVRVVLDPRGTRLEPGEILVCPATDPGWTPLFLAARGLVMEIGGMMTHGSVVAREYGIPAVVGVSHVTTRLQTGQRVRVDGNSGRVTVLESS